MERSSKRVQWVWPVRDTQLGRVFRYSVSEVSPLKNYFEIDGEHYYMNPLRNNIDEGDVVRIRFTPYAKYVVEVTQLSDEVQ